MERWETELLLHDTQAATRQAHFQQHPDALLVDEQVYLDHETWIRPAMAVLGNVRGLNVLDLGCGHGMAAVVLARRGANVWACDLSAGYVREVQQRSNANGVQARVHPLRATGERLPFADASFDAIWGNAILHHLDLQRALPELRRVLKPDGCFSFCEPWGGNPLLRCARRWLPYPGKERSPDEQPLTDHAVALVREVFPRLRWQPCQLLGMMRRVWPHVPGLSSLDRLDRAILTLPGLRGWCRYVLLYQPRQDAVS